MVVRDVGDAVRVLGWEVKNLNLVKDILVKVQKGEPVPEMEYSDNHLVDVIAEEHGVSLYLCRNACPPHMGCTDGGYRYTDDDCPGFEKNPSASMDMYEYDGLCEICKKFDVISDKKEPEIKNIAQAIENLTLEIEELYGLQRAVCDMYRLKQIQFEEVNGTYFKRGKRFGFFIVLPATKEEVEAVLSGKIKVKKDIHPEEEKRRIVPKDLLNDALGEVFELLDECEADEENEEDELS